jgi:hypothetical protein
VVELEQEMQSVSKGDYVIANDGSGNKKKTFLFKVESINKGIAEGTVEKDSHIKSRRFTAEAPLKNIVINLGPDPYPGKAYGHDVSTLYRGRKTHDFFGPTYWMYDASNEVKADLFKAFDKAERTLKHNGLEFLANPNTCIWEIQPNNGELYAGMYKRMKDPEKSPHRLQIRPEVMPSTEYPYVIFHEIGHHCHLEHVTGKKLNAQWIELFNTTIAVTSIKKEKSQELLDALLAQGDDLPSTFKANLSEEDTLVYQTILKTISSQHSVTVKELDILFEADYKDEIKGVWPVRGFSKKDLAPVVSEYACKNYKELFAESFAFRMVGKKLSKAVDSLLDKSLSYAKANREK